MTGKHAQFLVEGLIAKDIVNVTIQSQKMAETIVPLMAQVMSKQRDVMKIHAQVSITNKHTNFNKLLCSRFSMFYIIIILYVVFRSRYFDHFFAMVQLKNDLIIRDNFDC